VDGRQQKPKNNAELSTNVSLERRAARGDSDEYTENYLPQVVRTLRQRRKFHDR